MASDRPTAAELARFIWQHPANRGHRAAALARALGWQLEKRLFSRPVDVRLPGGVVLEVAPDSTAASQALYTSGLPDYHEMTFMLRLLEGGDHVVDVGANVGVWTLIAAAAVRPGRVTAFEPGDRARARLIDNLRRNDLLRDVEVRADVIGECTGAVVRFVSGSDTTNRILGADGHERPGQHETLVERRLVCLDDLFEAEQAPRLVKIDVEGAEPRVLGGATRLLDAARPPVWVIEWSRHMARHGRTPWALFRWLRERAWCVATYDADRPELTVHTRWSPHLEPGRAPRNVLLIAERAVDAVRAQVEG